MNIACGIDLVYLPRFKRSLKRGGENFLRRVFLEEEFDYPQNHLRGVPQAGRQTSQPRLTTAQHHLEGEISHLAGIFAAKEAVIKALSLPTDSWLNIFITFKPNGAPYVKIPYSIFHIPYSSLSISHDGNYVIAQFIAMLKE
jgi:phosphopantetheine--protein transferase-like protein